MDDTTGNTGSPYERSQEEVSWDAEFANMNDKRGSGPRLLNDMTRVMTRVPGAVARMPMDVIPDETAMHARAAVREGFLAFRSLLSAIADGVEGMLGEPSGKKASVWPTRHLGRRAIQQHNFHPSRQSPPHRG